MRDVTKEVTEQRAVAEGDEICIRDEEGTVLAQIDSDGDLFIPDSHWVNKCDLPLLVKFLLWAQKNGVIAEG